MTNSNYNVRKIAREWTEVDNDVKRAEQAPHPSPTTNNTTPDQKKKWYCLLEQNYISTQDFIKQLILQIKSLNCYSMDSSEELSKK